MTPVARARQPETFPVRWGAVTVTFALGDDYSRSWFLPRYRDGSLHEPATTRLLAARVGLARCFADVGANLGYYSCLAARINPACRVHAFEMDPDNYGLLRRNVELNGLETVACHRLAVADREGPVHYRRPYGGPSSGYRLEEPRQGDPLGSRFAAARAVDLDGFFVRREPVPDLVKIDVEGGELRVLRGMRRLLREAMPELLIEVHPVDLLLGRESPWELVDLLEDAGYRVAGVVSGPGGADGLEPVDQITFGAESRHLFAHPATGPRVSAEPRPHPRAPDDQTIRRKP